MLIFKLLIFLSKMNLLMYWTTVIAVILAYSDLIYRISAEVIDKTSFAISTMRLFRYR